MSDLSEEILNSVNDADEILNSFTNDVIEKAQQALKQDLDDLKFTFDNSVKEIREQIATNMADEMQALRDEFEIKNQQITESYQKHEEMQGQQVNEVSQKIDTIDITFKESLNSLSNDFSTVLMRQKRVYNTLIGLAILLSLVSICIATVALVLITQ